MSVFTSIAQYLLGLRSSRAGEADAGPAQGSGRPAQGGGGQSPIDAGALLDAEAARHPERLDWRHSIVDLLKLTGQDSSLAARQEMARELGYPGTPDGSEAMNEFLHRAVLDEIGRH